MILSRLRVALVAVALVVGMFAARLPQAQASAFEYTISATGTAATEGTGFRYTYTIHVEGVELGSVVDPFTPSRLLLPIFDVGAVSDINSPIGWTGGLVPKASSGWNYSSASDPNAGDYDAPASEFENPGYVLQWINAQISPVGGTQLGVAGLPLLEYDITGFNFFSDYGPGNGPIMVGVVINNTNNELTVADPPLPSSPNSPFATTDAVPEPATAGLGLLSLAALALTATRRRKA